MIRYASMALSLLALSACAGPQFGVLATKSPYAVPDSITQQAMANDVFSELSPLYPPGPTTLALLQPADDTFGAQLLYRFRQAGYAVEEYDPKITAPKGSVTLHYVVDNLAPTYWRVLLSVGSNTFSRGYVEPQTKNTYPTLVGAWVQGGQ